MTLEEIATLLASRKTEDHIRAVKRLTTLPATLARQRLLIKALNDRSNYVATLAAEALGETADVETLGLLLERFEALHQQGVKGDPGCHIRARLAFVFGQSEYHPASEALRAALKTRQIEAVAGVPQDTATHLRGNCALALAQLRVRDIAADIALLLWDRGYNAVDASWNARPLSSEPRKAAAQALARLADPAAIVPLALRLTYPEGESPDVLQECMQAVVALEDTRTQALLTPYLQHTDQHLAAFAALMLAQTREENVADLLLDVIERFSGDPLRAVLLALSTLRTPRAVAVLHELARHSRRDIREQAAELLPEGDNTLR